MFTTSPLRRSLAAACLFLCTFAPGTQAMATDEPTFTLVSHTKSFDVRRYDPVIIAETTIDGDWGEAGSQGFRRLAGYIFGGNKSRTKIAMTAPVGTQEGMRLPKATPDTVSQRGSGLWVVTFTMPARWTLATLPVPDDARVTLRQIPARLVAVKRVGGWWSAENFSKEAKLFLLELAKAGLRPTGSPPVLARYDPPWTPFFMRRNEILVEVTQ